MNAGSRGLVDPELLDLLDALPSPAMTVETLDHFRGTAAPSYLDPGAMPATNVSRRRIKGSASAPEIALEVYEPVNFHEGGGCILYLHGGGFVGGRSSAVEPRHCELTADLGCMLVAVDYRLAPETTFPGNLEDCYAALAWLHEQADVLKIDRNRIGVMGRSAGGGLAAALTLLARDRGEFAPAFQHLIYPMLDDRTCVMADPHPFTGEFVWTRENNGFGWSALLGAAPNAADFSPYAVPARAPDLRGLPPAFIGVGALDLFFEEDVEYARRLTRAGVPVELHVYPGAFHGFDFHRTAIVARAARRDSRAALSRFLERKWADPNSCVIKRETA